MLNKVLIANRGEIALRVLRACREMGIATVRSRKLQCNERTKQLFEASSKQQSTAQIRAA